MHWKPEKPNEKSVINTSNTDIKRITNKKTATQEWLFFFFNRFELLHVCRQNAESTGLAIKPISSKIGTKILIKKGTRIVFPFLFSGWRR
ncbi:hypothetical protein BCT30_18960 [Enterovibrio norvegicus]|nr:hypothetical protein BCU47_08445 [Enterovibrio norvegicus]PMI39136.1 hypothetical protein BCU46_06785 [Enterovibrio norvegicus]PMN49591.1 hypothetical protein BCT30_18960 [Enterovibrio norvegicus]